MSLIDLNGSLGRIDGGIGITLTKPNVIIEFSNETNSGIEIFAPDEYKAEIRRIIKIFQEKFNVKFLNLLFSVLLQTAHFTVIYRQFLSDTVHLKKLVNL